MIADLLEQAGIYARVDGDYLQGGVGELQPTGFIRVRVNNDDFDTARKLVLQWDAAQPLGQPVPAAGGFTWLHLLMSFVLGIAVGMVLIYENIITG